MIDYQELKRLAEAATQGQWMYECDYLFFKDAEGFTRHLMEICEGQDIAIGHDSNLKFIAAANPAAVLALIAEVETLESYLCTCPDCGGEGEIFTGSYSYFGHMDPPEPNMDKCVECDGKGLIGTPQNLHTVITERDQLKAEVEALRKDAERYRWLMNKGLHTEIYSNSAGIAPGRGPYICIDLPSSGAPNRVALGSGSDGYIDAAMSKESEQ